MLLQLGNKAAQAALRPFGLQLRRISSDLDGVRAPQPSLEMRHVENCLVLPGRQELLRRLPSGGVVAELGVADGDFSADILSLNRPRKLHLVDPWASARYAVGYERVRERFGEEMDEGRVAIHRGRSVDVMCEFADSYFDWVYIDTDHRFETTLAELAVCARKVKPDGHIAGHDFAVGSPTSGMRYGVIPACHRFCSEQGWQLAFLTVEHTTMSSFCLRRL